MDIGTSSAYRCSIDYQISGEVVLKSLGGKCIRGQRLEPCQVLVHRCTHQELGTDRALSRKLELFISVSLKVSLLSIDLFRTLITVQCTLAIDMHSKFEPSNCVDIKMMLPFERIGSFPEEQVYK